MNDAQTIAAAIIYAAERITSAIRGQTGSDTYNRQHAINVTRAFMAAQPYEPTPADNL